MAMSNDEALIVVSDQITEILYYFLAPDDEEMSESDMADLELFASNLAESVLMSLSFDVSSVGDDGKINATLSPRDVMEFIDELSEATLVGE